MPVRNFSKIFIIMMNFKSIKVIKHFLCKNHISGKGKVALHFFFAVSKSILDSVFGEKFVKFEEIKEQESSVLKSD